ncbi:ABC transporter substrate-binding protein [Paenibacillus radicis (ex Gao et al. 2016)]|uniref:ABC transporter substrate-binding lipoprotein YvrC n=1 Tax=Paenibacillus radicis (ex Gao et al. 2016) TaxID=1737354 RepID=A0A917HP44_9BACL|nr:ABC transporter substrate-binding protein [Paenibacillus radicis (ex Gao et al. 2016)]GGG85808.1 putative ABC transporter substrate-binding lipoprotein YvrC [Paenibacillus radicis (ex Gao et al. 2016)]
MNPNKRWFLWLAGMCILVILSACSSSTTANSGQSGASTASPNKDEQGQPPPYLTFKDASGEQVTLKRKPERIVLLNTEAMALFDQLGGTAVGLATAPGTELPEGAKTVDMVGEIQAVSLEKVIALKPDLVIGQAFFHAGLRKSLAASGIPLALTKIDSYDKVIETGILFGQLLGKEKETEQAVKEMQSRIQAIVEKVPNQPVSFAAITIMPMGVSIQKSGTLTLDIADRLKLRNIADDMPAGDHPGSVPYSIESLIAADPDYIFLVVHGTEEEGKERLKEDMEKNPAWSSLRAVKEGKLSFLPADFVNNPGLDMDRPFSYLAHLVYPDAFEN